MQIEIIASSEIYEVLKRLGRTEDVCFSPNKERLVVAGFGENTCVAFDLHFERSSAGSKVILTDYVEITSPALLMPHGLSFLEPDKILVANRSGKVDLLPLPASGTNQKTFNVQPIKTLKGGLFQRLSSPGSVTAYRRENGKHEVLVCNNYVNRVTRHRLGRGPSYFVNSNRTLLAKNLKIPDGIDVSANRKWIAISNHGTGNVFLYRNDRHLGPRSDAVGVLNSITFPHGVRFTEDDQHILVADAGQPLVHVFQKQGEDWSGNLTPLKSIQIMDDGMFVRGNHCPEEGGPKGLAIQADLDVMVTTCEEQPLAFFELSKLLN